MKHTMIAAILLASFVAVPSQGAAGSSQAPVEIYVTAKDTDQRLAKAGEMELQDSPLIHEEQQYITVP